MLQCIEANKCLSCFLNRDKVFCCRPPPFVLVIRAYGKINVDDVSIHRNVLPVLFYGFWFIIFQASSYSLRTFLNPQAPTLARGVLSRLFPNIWCHNVGQMVNPEMHRTVARCVREYVRDPARKLHHGWRGE